MTPKQKKLIENYVRFKVKSMLKESEGSELSEKGWTVSDRGKWGVIIKQTGAGNGESWEWDKALTVAKLILKLSKTR